MFTLKIQRPTSIPPTLINANTTTINQQQQQQVQQIQQIQPQNTELKVFSLHSAEESRARLRRKIAESQCRRTLKVNWSALKQ